MSTFYFQFIGALFVVSWSLVIILAYQDYGKNKKPDYLAVLVVITAFVSAAFLVFGVVFNLVGYLLKG